jgi:hypothetical protein
LRQQPGDSRNTRPTLRGRKLKKLSKIQTAIVILKFRAAKARESIRIDHIANEAGCTPQNLYKSPEFMNEFNSARARRTRRGWKIEGVADCPDDSTMDVDKS